MLGLQRHLTHDSPVSGAPFPYALSAMTPRTPEIRFYAATDGRRLAVRVWPVDNAEAPQVVMLHGIMSHGGWYDRSCEFLSEAGHEVHFIDRRGSGLNGEARGDVDRWESWCDDVIQYLAQIRGRRPLVLCGISWGGKLAAAVARRKPHLLDGLGLLCPGLYAQQQPGPLRRLVLRAARSHRLQNRRARIPLHPELFTNSPGWQNYVRNDPLTLREVTLRFARADLALTRYARQSAPYIHTPTLLMLTGQDRIVKNDATRSYLGRIAAKDKMLIEYENAGHTLEFEPNPTQYFEDLTTWVGRIEEGK